MDIHDVVARRSDLSTFVVHLTRDEGDETAVGRLNSILSAWQIEARTAFGPVKAKLQSQKCVCFTETPLDYLHLHVQRIDGRDAQFAPYGTDYRSLIIVDLIPVEILHRLGYSLVKLELWRHFRPAPRV